MKKTIIAIASGVAALFLITAGCSAVTQETAYEKARKAGMTNAQALACGDLKDAHNTTSSEDQNGRIDMATKVNKWAQTAGGDLKARGDELALIAPLGPAAAWDAAVDRMATECIELGWPKK